jgi:hypothetical protein
MPLPKKRHDHYTDYCMLYARDTKEIESFIKTLRDD